MTLKRFVLLEVLFALFVLAVVFGPRQADANIFRVFPLLAIMGVAWRGFLVTLLIGLIRNAWLGPFPPSDDYAVESMQLQFIILMDVILRWLTRKFRRRSQEADAGDSG